MWKKVIDGFDKIDRKHFSEHEVHEELRKVYVEAEATFELKAEAMAFNFSETQGISDWGTYFGPMHVFGNMEAPSIKLVTAEMIEYWKSRSQKCVNPILKSRYIGLVCDFEKRITDKKPSYQSQRDWANALLDIAKGKYYKKEHSTFLRLKQALKVALSINAVEIINDCKNTIIDYERQGKEEIKSGIYGYAFDYLIENGTVKLTDEERDSIITDLENRLREYTAALESGKVDWRTIEWVAVRLGTYYRKKQRYNDVRRVILEVGKAVNLTADTSSGMRAIHVYENLHKLYVQFGLTNDLDAVLIKIRDFGPQARSELQPIPFSFSIPRQELEESIDEFVTGTLEEVLRRIAESYIPSIIEAKERLMEEKRSTPSLFLFNTVVYDSKGRVVTNIGSLDTDLEGHLVRKIQQKIMTSSIFLNLTIQKTIEKLGLNSLNTVEFISSANVFSPNRLSIINRGIESYFANDHLVAIHLLVPQIEEAVRNIIENAGGNVLRQKGSGMQLRTFDDILRDDLLKDKWGEDMVEYFKALYTDQRGINLRNDVSHGMADIKAFNQQNADKVLHSLLCMCLPKE